MKIYKHYFKSGKLMRTARIIKLYEWYVFETSECVGKNAPEPYVININMPRMRTETEAIHWIENNKEWK